MSDNTNATEIKQLRNEVQMLRDELAIMKRKYEDIIYNLDTDNFSGRFIKEQGDMRTAIEVNAKGIKTKVSNEEFSSQMELTADAIKTKVSQADVDKKLESYSTIEQTSESIRAAVEKLDIDVDLSNYSTIEMTSDAITSVVSKGANLKKAEVWKGTLDSLQEQTNAEDSTVDTNKIYVIQTKNEAHTKVISETYYYYNTVTNKWEFLSGDNIYTMFTQTENGFEFKGNVVINGGSITWSDGDNPLLVRYSSNGTSWHKTFLSDDLYMKTSLDGGVTWSGAMRIVGEKGKDGADGKDAEVTFQAVNSALDNLFRTKNGGSVTTMSKAYIYSPKVASGKFYGCDFYAGSGKGYAHMNEDGLDVYDAGGNNKIGIGCKLDGETYYPYVKVGAGTGSTIKNAGAILKLGKGLWIGDSSILEKDYISDYPSGDILSDLITSGLGSGIFIDFETGSFYLYQNGDPHKIL